MARRHMHKMLDEDNKSHILIKKYKLFNFDNVKTLSFSDFNKLNIKIDWFNSYDFYSQLDAKEASYRSNYDSEAIEFFYTRINKIVPLTFRLDEKKFKKEFITDLFHHINPPETSLRIIQELNKQLSVSEFTLTLEKDLVMFFDSSDITFFINPLKHLEQTNNNLFYLIIRLLNGYLNDDIQKNKINIVYKSDYGFDKMSFDVKKIDININENYNDDFNDILENMINSLNQKNKSGLYILNGSPGTGKTTIIRFLTSKINRNIIFISPDMVEYITDPSFIPFLMENSDSVLIIEDAEPALQKRDGTGRTGAISNILNLTDGLLSDCLNISIIATFNTNTKTLDEALLREGRLINSYSFEKLCVEKSQKLLNKLGHNVKVTEPMKLSEIYFYGQNNKNNLLKNKKQIGFG